MPQNHLTILTGASRGMGLAMAQQLLKSGNTLVCIARSTNADLAIEAKAAGVTIEQWQQDLSQGEQAAHKLQAWLQAQGPQAFASATLINNAGMIPQIAPLSHSNVDDLATALRVGLEAPMQLTAAFLGATDSWTVPRKVLNISSGLGRRAMASQAAYCAAKAGMDHFTRCVALEEAHKPGGAKICSLAPGVIDTDMQAQLRGADAAAFPDRTSFVSLKDQGLLASPEAAATQVLSWLRRNDFGVNPVADVR